MQNGVGTSGTFHAALTTASPWIVRFAQLVSAGGSVLDLACGGGRNGRHFLERGHPVTFLDRDTSGIADIADGSDVEVIAADLEDGSAWPLGDRQFAAVVIVSYLFRPVLPAIVNAIAPGGVLLYETFAQGNERYGRPSNPDFLLAPGELIDAVGGRLTALAYQHGLTGENDSRAVKQAIAAVNGPADATPIPPA